MNTTLAKSTNEFTDSGFNVIASSLQYLEINYQVPPPADEPSPPGYICTIENGARICTSNNFTFLLFLFIFIKICKILIYIIGIYTPHKFSTGLAAGLGALVGLYYSLIFIQFIIILIIFIIGVGVLVAVFAAVVLLYNFTTFTKKYGTFYCGVIIFGVYFFSHLFILFGLYFTNNLNIGYLKLCSCCNFAS